MRFVIVGAGALGSIVAAHLARAGTPVALVARGRRADQIEAQGVPLIGLAEFSVQVPVIRPGTQEIDGDVMILCTKAYDTDEALAPLKFKAPPIALSLQNGVLKNDDLARFYGAGQVLGAAASVAGELLPDGTTRFTMNDRLPIGEPAGGVSARVREIVDALKTAGIAAEAAEDIASVEWSKYAGFLPLMAAGVLTRQFTWRNLSDPGVSQVVARLMREVVALATASGVAVEDKGGLPVASIASAPADSAAAIIRKFGAGMEKRAPQHRVSALQDLLRGGRLEVDAILGHASRLGARLAVPVPTIDTCHQLCTVLATPSKE